MYGNYLLVYPYGVSVTGLHLMLSVCFSYLCVLMMIAHVIMHGVMQAIDEDMWSQACKALQQTRDQLGGYHAWLWARDHYPTWLHKDPSCYLFLVLAIASNHDQPVEGKHIPFVTSHYSMLSWSHSSHLQPVA